MKTLRFLLFLSLVSFIFSCKKETTPAKDDETTPPPPGDATVIYNVNKATLLELVNNARKSGCTCGITAMPSVPALTWNDLLAKAAYDHSKDMKTNNYFSHTGLNGSSAGDRIKKAGYNWSWYGENIANGYTSEQAVMTGWLNSEGHCKNIMSANVKEMGAGREGNYWTQVFGSN